EAPRLLPARSPHGTCAASSTRSPLLERRRARELHREPGVCGVDPLWGWVVASVLVGENPTIPWLFRALPPYTRVRVRTAHRANRFGNRMRHLPTRLPW